MSTMGTTKGSTSRGRAAFKDPMSDFHIAGQHARREKELKNEKTAMDLSNVTGMMLRGDLHVKKLQQEVKALADGIEEYEGRLSLIAESKRRHTIERQKHLDWCETFDKHIGPFEQQYEEAKAEVGVSFDYAKRKYNESYQKLIDDFGFHPQYKRWFDEF